MAKVEFINVSKSFGDVRVIENMNLTIQDGSFTVLVGASGCGKTTLLRMIAGIGPATGGKILLDGRDISALPPGKRDIAMVFQNYAIYPTMSVRENIEYGLKNKKVPKAERDRLIAEYAQIVGLTEYLGRKPGTLSGGQRQRVALARAMVKKPQVFLMDEPLSNLDAKLRVAMRSELIELHHRLKTTFVYVTHDQVEAMSMADSIVLMDKGRIMQEASPRVIYRDPDNVFTAQFIGTPPMNILPLQNGSLGFRPERVLLTEDKPQSAFYTLRGTVVTREMLGSETQFKIHLEAPGARDVMVKTERDFEDAMGAGRAVYMALAADDLYFFNADGDRVRRGDAAYESLAGQAGGGGYAGV